jgi:hypothetical protein
MSLLMVDMLKKILKKPDNTLDSSLAEKLLGSMNLLDTRMKNMDKCMSEVFENKFAEFKQNYTQELNTILNNTTNERAITVLKDYNETMQDKTKLLFNELFPKNNEFIANQINNTFNIFDKLINSTEARLQNTITDTKNTIESKLTNINTITNTQNVISENINHLINKFHGSSTKGMFSEVSVVEGLTRIYPYGNVEHVGNKISSSGDIILTRKDKNKIIAGFGAPAKATTAINYFGIETFFDYVIEDNNLKHNKYIPGTKIKIISKEKLKDKIDCLIVLAWNFFDEIKKNNKIISKKIISIKELEK